MLFHLIILVVGGVGLCASKNIIYPTPYNSKESFKDDYPGYRRTLETYNADLTPFVCPKENLRTNHPMTCSYQTRLEEQIKRLKTRKNTDLICLQGVWYAKDLTEIVVATKDLFKYSLSFVHENEDILNRQVHVPPCFGPEGRKIITLVEHCDYDVCYGELNRWDMLRCMETRCNITPELRNTSELCLECISQGTQNNYMECRLATYEANPTGLLLLSKRHIHTQKRSYYHKSSELVQTGYLDVKVDGIGHVVCTHLTEHQSEEYIEVSTEFKSYAEKNLDEAMVLTHLLKDEPRVIIMGDLCAGFGTAESRIGSQFTKTMRHFLDNGFIDSDGYSDNDCLYCCGNTLVRDPDMCYDGVDSVDGYIFEHILLKGYKDDRIKKRRTFEVKEPDDKIMSRFMGISVVIFSPYN